MADMMREGMDDKINRKLQVAGDYIGKFKQ